MTMHGTSVHVGSPQACQTHVILDMVCCQGGVRAGSDYSQVERRSVTSLDHLCREEKPLG